MRKLKILQMVTLMSPDGAFGGPVSVARAQSEALARDGHAVTLLAASPASYSPVSPEGVQLLTFPARSIVASLGFSGIISPGLMGWLSHNLREFDIFHVHLARDLITLPSAYMLLRGHRSLVVQTHGMVDESSKPLAHIIDRLTRPVLRGADRLLWLTEKERRSLEVVARGELPRTTFLRNGVEPGSICPESAGPPEALFVARMHPRKNAPMFAQASANLLARGSQAKFSILGPDEGDLAHVQGIVNAADHARLTYDGALTPRAVMARLSKAAIYVLPSVDEPFPMTVLEAMSVGRPVIVTESNGLAATIRESEAGLVIDPHPVALERAMHRLLADRTMRLQMGTNAFNLVRAKFSAKEVAKDLARMYAEVVTVSG